MKKNNICRLPLADETEVKQKKKIFCSMYQPFDTTDEKRITNYGIFYVGKDVGRDQAFVDLMHTKQLLRTLGKMQLVI